MAKGDCGEARLYSRLYGLCAGTVPYGKCKVADSFKEIGTAEKMADSLEAAILSQRGRGGAGGSAAG